MLELLFVKGWANCDVACNRGVGVDSAGQPEPRRPRAIRDPQAGFTIAYANQDRLHACLQEPRDLFWPAQHPCFVAGEPARLGIDVIEKADQVVHAHLTHDIGHHEGMSRCTPHDDLGPRARLGRQFPINHTGPRFHWAARTSKRRRAPQ